MLARIAGLTAGILLAADVLMAATPEMGGFEVTRGAGLADGGSPTFNGLTMDGGINLDGQRLNLDADRDSYTYALTDDVIRLVVGGTTRLTYGADNVNVGSNVRIYNGAEALNLGAAATTSHGLTTGDVLVGGKLEVDDASFFDSTINVANNVNLYFSSGASGLGILGNTTTAQARLSVGDSVGTQLLLVDEDARNDDYGHADRLHPTLCWHSATRASSSTSEWTSIHHDGPDGGVIATGDGDLRLEPAGDIRADGKTIYFGNTGSGDPPSLATTSNNNVQLNLGASAGFAFYCNSAQCDFRKRISNGAAATRLGGSYTPTTISDATGAVAIGQNSSGESLEAKGQAHFMSAIVPAKLTGDPCGTYPIGSLFFNATDNYLCFCNSSGDDVQMHSPGTACF